MKDNHDVELGLTNNRNITLLRHGETNWSRDMLKNGPVDLDLNEAGIKEVQASIESLKTKNITHIYSSSFLRAKRSAEIISDALGVPIIINEGLNERYFGNFENKKDILENFNQYIGSLSSKDDDYHEKLLDIPMVCLPSDAESRKAFEERVNKTFDEIRKKSESGKNILAVTHGCVKYAFYRKLLSIGSLPRLEDSYGKPDYLRIVSPSEAINPEGASTIISKFKSDYKNHLIRSNSTPVRRNCTSSSCSVM